MSVAQFRHRHHHYHNSAAPAAAAPAGMCFRRACAGRAPHPHHAVFQPRRSILGVRTVSRYPYRSLSRFPTYTRRA